MALSGSIRPVQEQTRRAYENAIHDFMGLTGIKGPDEFRTVTRAHIIAWRDDLKRRGLGGSTIRHRLSSLASLFVLAVSRSHLRLPHSPSPHDKGVKS
jgi:site-specific recombinase XerC